MKGIFVNQTNCSRYADLIANGYKTIETRSRNMLSALVGERVAIVRTMSGKNPLVIGYVDIVGSVYSKDKTAADYPECTFVPDTSKFANNRWFYLLRNPERCEAFPLPSSAIRHGRSWCEF